MKKLKWNTAFAACLISTGLINQSVNAQDSLEEEASRPNLFLDTVVVTGTKKADPEDVQDVPVSITAFGGEQLEALKVRDLQGLTYTAPNVALDDIGTTKGVANFSIRGLGINSSIPSIDPTVGVFVDGMYLGINSGVVFDIFDLESIEVLRGPQGILFGRNTTGGAVLLNTRKPDQDWKGRVKFAGESGFRGTGESLYAMGAFSGALIEDKLAAKLVIYHNKDNGWHKNKLGGSGLEDQVLGMGGTTAFLQASGFPIATNTAEGSESHGASETTIVRPSLYWTPSDQFELTVRYERGKAEGDGPAVQNHPGANGIPNPFFSASRNGFDFSNDERGNFENEWDQLIGEARLDFGDAGVITSIAGWREFSSTARSDIDGTPFFLFHGDLGLEQEQFSEEIRYNNRFADVLDLTAGVFYFEQDILYSEGRELLGGAIFLNGGGKQDQETLGVFSQFDFDLSETLSLTIGARYTREEKDVIISTLSLNPVECDPGVRGECSEDFQDSESWNNFTPKIGFTWKALENVNVYGHWTKGVRSGGYNLRSSNQAVPPGPFDEETINAYEIGFKSEPMGGRAIFNGSVFFNEIEDMQREVILADENVGVAQVIRNTADAQIFGVELDGRLSVTENVLLQGSLGYMEGEYTSVAFDLNGDGLVNSIDEQLEVPRLAPWTWGVGIIHNVDLSDDVSLSSRLNYSYREKSFYTDDNLGFFNPVDSVDANFALDFGGTSLSLYGKNLLNEVNHGADSQLPASLGFGAAGALMKGRVIGLEVQTKF